MVARSDVRFAGGAALLTSALLTAQVIVFSGGPTTDRPKGVLAWHLNHTTEARLSSVLWLLAMLSFVIFAITFREALWASIIDRHWVSVAFVQGSGVFAAIAVVWAALSWALATGADAGIFGATEIGLLWAVQQAVMRFAMWGLVAPLLLIGLPLIRYSAAGKVAAVAAVGVSATMVIPDAAPYAMTALAAWMCLTGLTLLGPTMESLKSNRPSNRESESV